MTKLSFLPSLQKTRHPTPGGNTTYRLTVNCNWTQISDNMRITFTTLIFLALTSCWSEKNGLQKFELVDISVFNGWTDLYCLKIFKDGKAFIYNDKYGEGETYFQVNLGSTELDSISLMSDKILNSRLDTLYEGFCVDCGSINLVIKSKDKAVRTHIAGIDEKNPKIQNIISLANFVYKIAAVSKVKIDSNFVFESLKRSFFPPPPPIIDLQGKYVPPDSTYRIR
jgi:hypothetical protein